MSTFKRSTVIILDQQRETCVGLIQCIKEWKSFIVPEENHNSVGDLSFGRNISDGVFEYWKPKVLYILSNDKSEIKDGDYVFVDCTKNTGDYKGQGIWKYKKAPCSMPYWGNIEFAKKIIATTDETLGLPCPSKGFIIKYIADYNEDNIITSVLVEYEQYHPSTVNILCDDGLFVPKVSLISNTIVIRSIKNNYTEHDVQDILITFALSINTVDKQVHPENYVQNWINENLNNPF